MSDRSSGIRCLFLSLLFLSSIILSARNNFSSQEQCQKNLISMSPDVSIESNPVYSNDNFNSTIHGSGEGLYQIRDSLIRITKSSLDTTNSIMNGNPTDNNDTFTVSSLDGYSWNTLNFHLENVTANDDWRSIENETVDADTRLSLTYLEAAQEFKVKEDYANITQVSIYLKYVDDAKDGKIPHGNVSIFDDNSGEPGNQLGTTRLEDAFALLDLGVPIGPTWVTYSFSKSINVSKGSYWLVLNDTGNQAFGHWEWYTQDDINNKDAGDWAAKASHDGSWVSNPFPAGDILSVVRILPTNENWDKLTYTSPTQIGLTYNSTLGNYTLSSFSFIANDTSTHSFQANTSVLLNIKNYANFTYLFNPVNGHAAYKVANNSISSWELTFSTNRVITSDLIRNRMIAITGIHPDWYGSRIYWNDSNTPEYTNLTNNVNITWDGNPTHKYTYGNTSMVINASTLYQNVTWHIWFNASNYLLDFNISRDDSSLSTPYKVYVTDILDLDFMVSLPGGNISYWIDYYGLFVHSNTNFNTTHTTFGDTWDINASIDTTRTANGTYILQAFWHDINKTKVGTFTRSVDIIIKTSLKTETENIITIGQKLVILVFYKSIHNNSHIMNAPILCEANWSKDVHMNQLTDGSYNASFDSIGCKNGEIGHINISTQMKWFVNWTVTLHVKFVLHPPNFTSTPSETSPSIPEISFDNRTQANEGDFGNPFLFLSIVLLLIFSVLASGVIISKLRK